MPILAELYVATRTRNTADADTENLPVLVVKRGPDVVFTKPTDGRVTDRRSITDAAAEFTLSGLGLGSITLDPAHAPLLTIDGATSLTLISANGVEQVLLRKDVNGVRRLATSLMPSYAEGLKPSDLADLLAWLRSNLKATVPTPKGAKAK